MLTIGITGGVGAGKSTVLGILKEIPGVRIYLADEIAHKLMEPGTDCYWKLRDTFPQAALYEADGSFCRNELAKLLFTDKKAMEKLNAIVHPAVRAFVCRQIGEERQKGQTKVFVLEAALLIEEHYELVLDELWYIYAGEETRRRRLSVSRGYSPEKIDSIMKSQKSEEEFRRVCTETIDNDGSPEETGQQLFQLLLARGIPLAI